MDVFKIRDILVENWIDEGYFVYWKSLEIIIS
jgi:hypothetical protein